MSTAISIKKMSFSYQTNQEQVISYMDLDMAGGTVNAVLGANGVGKTTLLYLLIGVYKATHGDIFFFDQLQADIPASRMKQIVGMVSQNDAVPFDLSVEEYVLLGRAPHLKLLQIPTKADKYEVKKALETVGLTHMANCGMTRLSSGEKQLVNVARALTQNPEILLLDEPCSHLDLINSRQMLNMMKTIAQSNRTVVFTTHDPNAASAIADQVILLKKGTLVAKGSPENTLTPKLLTTTYGGNIEVINTDKGPLVMAV